MHKIKSKFLSAPKYVQFGILNSLVFFIIGIYGSTVYFGLTRYYFFISAPITAYFVFSRLWYYIFLEDVINIDSNIGTIAAAGTMLTHWLSLITLQSIDILIDFARGRADLVPDFAGMFLVSIPFTFYTIFHFYLLTFLVPILIAFCVHKKTVNPWNAIFR